MIYKISTRYNIGRGSRAGKGSQESDKGDESERSSDTLPSFYQVPILESSTFSLRTLISNRKSLILQVPASGYADPGLLGCNAAST